MFKNLKRWKTIIQFIITVLTAIISSFFVQSCMKSRSAPADSMTPPGYVTQIPQITQIFLSDDSHHDDCFIHACMNKGSNFAEVLMKASFQYT